MQILRTLGVIGLDQTITAAEMKAYDRLFAVPIPFSVLTAIAALVGRTIPTAIPLRANVDIACES